MSKTRNRMLHRICKIYIHVEPDLSTFVKSNNDNLIRFFTGVFHDEDNSRDFIQTFWTWMWEKYCKQENSFVNVETPAGKAAFLYAFRGNLWDHYGRFSRKPDMSWERQYDTVKESDLFRTKAGNLDEMFSAPSEHQPDYQLVMNQFFTDVEKNLNKGQHEVFMMKFYGYSRDYICDQQGYGHRTFHRKMAEIEPIIAELRKKHFGDVGDLFDVVEGSSSERAGHDDYSDTYETNHVSKLFG